MRRLQIVSPVAFALAALLSGACEVADTPFHDKGEGTWLAMLDIPDIDYRAMWGASADDVYAVGTGGFAHHDGVAWQRVNDVPDVDYRAVWGRSSERVWIGGDNVLLARSLTGWQEQSLWHGDFEIVEYSVLALAGDSRREYALILTGGQVLMLINEGALWETPYWRGGSGPGQSLPLAPHVVPRYGQLLVGGDGELVTMRKSDLLWEAYRWSAGDELPALTAMAGELDFFVAAGAGRLFIYRVATGEIEILSEDRSLLQSVADLFAIGPDRFFAVGTSTHLDRPDPASGVQMSSIAACDATGCALESIEAGYESAALQAVWGDGAGTVMAAGDGAIFVRQLKE